MSDVTKAYAEWYASLRAQGATFKQVAGETYPVALVGADAYGEPHVLRWEPTKMIRAEFSPGVQATIAQWDEQHARCHAQEIIARWNEMSATDAQSDAMSCAIEANMQRADEPVDPDYEFSVVCDALSAGTVRPACVQALRNALAAYDALAASQKPVATVSKPGVPTAALRARYVPGYGGLR